MLAVELSKKLVAAAQENLTQNAVCNVTAVACDSQKMANSILRRKTYFNPRNKDEVLRFSTVLVDPPRGGLDDLTRQMVGRYDTVIYISCNPHDALVRDLKEICLTHTVERAAAFDHFPYTPHLEMAVILRKKMQK